ncbi:MAG: hypothetical protein OHK0029_15350 [Armatimonadaceae bacterium]
MVSKRGISVVAFCIAPLMVAGAGSFANAQSSSPSESIYTVSRRVAYRVVDLGELGGGFVRARDITGDGLVLGEAEVVRGEWKPEVWTASMWGPNTYFDRDAAYARRQVLPLSALGAWLGAPFGTPRNTQDLYNPDFDGFGRRVGNTGRYIEKVTQEPIVFRNGRLTALGNLGGSKGVATAGNRNGQIVGTSLAHDYLGPYRAFLYQPSQTPGQRSHMTDLGTLGGQTSIAHDINDAGVVVGDSDMGGEIQRAFCYKDGTMRDLGTLGGSQSYARAINNRSQIVGWSENRRYEIRAVLWEASTMRELETSPDLIATYAHSINDLGHAVGSAEVEPEVYRAALWDRRGRLAILGTLGGKWSEATAINDRAQIVGSSANDAGQERAFLWESRRLYDLNHLIPPDSGWELVRAESINDRGEIVGWGKKNGKTRAFLLIPR